MASSGYKSVAVTSYDTLKFSWAQVSQSVANNTTQISWTLQLIAAAYGRIDSSASKAWKVTVNGTEYSGTTTVGIANNATKTLASGKTTITHNADGSKSFSYSFSQAFDITFSGTKIGTKSGSGTGTLNTIPRATTPTLSASSVDMGGSVTINTPRASSSFTHDLAYSFAGAAYVSIATGVATSKAWTVPDLASKIPNATSGTVTIRCITKNGSTTIGTKTVTMTAKVPTSVVPTVSSVAVAETVSGIAAQFGAYVQNKSKVKATITAAGAKGSTIKAYQSTFQGLTYTTASWTSGLLATAGTLAIKTRVQDSRGRWSAYKTTNVTVLAYTAPSITSFKVSRCDATGTATNGGEYMAVAYKYGVASVGNRNTVSLVVEYKLDTEGEDAYKTLLTGSALAADATSYPTGATFSPDYMYDVRITVTDWFSAKASAVALLPSEAVIIDINAEGDGISFGMVSTLAGVDIGYVTRHTGGLLAPLLEPNTNLDDVRTPNTYEGANVSTYNYGNCPIKSGTFTLTVKGAGGEGQLLQRLQECKKTDARTFERFYYQGAWGEWVCVSDFAGTLLWSGGYYMTAGHTINLAEPISKQPSGIVLVFSEYADGAAKDSSFHCRFIPKRMVGLHPGSAQCIQLSTSNVAYFATKYLYISDSKIVGHDNNGLTLTGASGLTATNTRFVLRYVIGV